MATQACPLVPGARAIACNDIAGPGLLGQTELLEEFAAIPIHPCNSSSQAAHESIPVLFARRLRRVQPGSHLAPGSLNRIEVLGR